MHKVIQLPYGLKNNRLVHVDETVSGLDCNCICPSCHSPLVAKKGKNIKNHFAHHVNTSCINGLETSVHLAAKQIISDEKGIDFPYLEARTSCKDNIGKLHEKNKVISKNIFYSLDSIALETKFANTIPDIIAYYKGQPIIIEIAVTHFVDNTKLKKIKALNIACIEIDLSKIKDYFSLSELQESVLSAAPRKWVHNPKYVSLLPVLQKQAEAIADAANRIHKNDCEIHARKLDKVLDKWAGEYRQLSRRTK